MYSIQFPNMLLGQKTALVQDHDATYQNLRCLLLSDKMSMIGDPYYGTNLKRLLYSQSRILKDILLDDVFTAVAMFMPQLKMSRNDMDIYVKNQNVYVSLSCTNVLDHVNNLYQICLTSTEQ